MSGPTTVRAVTLTGATGLVGHFLLPVLVESGFEVHAVSRRGGPASGPVRWSKLDLGGPIDVGEGREGAPPAPGGDRGLDAVRPDLPVRTDVVIHAAPLWLLPPWLRTFIDLGARRIVAFSSTSRITKEFSEQPEERETARRLAEAEEAVARECEVAGVPWTLFRPTLIYGGGRDRNVTDIARVIGRLGFFPLAGDGRGRRQPVHGEDLARACLAVLDNEATHGRGYELPGGETLTYAQMAPARINPVDFFIR